MSASIVATDVTVAWVLGAVVVDIPNRAFPSPVSVALTPAAAYELGVRLIQSSIAAKRDLETLEIPGERA